MHQRLSMWNPRMMTVDHVVLTISYGVWPHSDILGFLHARCQILYHILGEGGVADGMAVDGRRIQLDWATKKDYKVFGWAWREYSSSYSPRYISCSSHPMPLISTIQLSWGIDPSSVLQMRYFPRTMHSDTLQLGWLSFKGARKSMFSITVFLL